MSRAGQFARTRHGPGPAALYYPEIPGSRHAPLGRCVAFEKLDGTNPHWARDRDFGWHAFGTRRDEFQLTDAGVGEFARRHAHPREAAAVFRVALADGVERVLRDHPAYQEVQAVTVFGEFLGPHSFAGRHRADDRKEVRMFDVLAGPAGLVGPEQFVRDFGHLPTPRVVYRGRRTWTFLESGPAGTPWPRG